MSQVKYYSGGGANSIGCSFSLLIFDNKHYIGMDWGGGHDNIYSEPRYRGPLEYLFISHAHLDHGMQIPKLKQRYPNVRIFATAPTAELCEVGWYQTLKLAKGTPPFSKEDIKQAKSSIEIIESDSEIKISDDLFVYAINSGHILGAISLLIIYKGEHFFLTSDISFQNRHLIKGAPLLSMERSRLLVRESTYINKKFEDRETTISKFTEAVKEVLAKGGRVLVPALSIDRTQDILAVLLEANISPVYIDGSKQATETYIKYLGEKATVLKNALRFEDNASRREFLKSKKPAVIVSSSGMIHAGSLSSFWATHIAPNEKDGIFMVNYQDPDSQGSKLFKTKEGRFLVLGGKIVKKSCQMRSFNFSCHMSGEDGLLLEERMNPTTVIYNHGQDNEIDRHLRNFPSGRRRIKARVGMTVEV